MRALFFVPILLCGLAIASFASVTVSSPTNGATVESPVKFVARAKFTNQISGMVIYVDSKSVYSTSAASINTSIGMSSGTHAIVVEATNSQGTIYSDSLTLNVSSATTSKPSALQLTSTSVANGTVGAAYSATLQAIGGVTPYKWGVASGTLPAGLTLSTGGTISGTATAAGTSSFGVSVKDAESTPQTATATLKLTVVAATPTVTPLQLSTSALANGMVGSAYSAALTAAGGSAPYTWSLASGSLPAGLTLSAGGTISGTASAAGTSSFSVTVKDSEPSPQAATSAFTLTITPTTLQLTTTSLGNGAIGSAYSATLQATGGTQPYTWSLASGTLPTGLEFSSSGVISGTPTASGGFSFTIEAKDSETSPQTATGAESIAVVAANSSTSPCTGSCYYVSPTGSDSNPGTLAAPFATFGKAQSAMRASSTIKTTYLRVGTYTPSAVVVGGGPTTTALYLTSADSGETWSYYPPDGYNTAIINGGATEGCLNSNGITYGFWIEGGSNITVNGLTFENYTGSGVLLHAGTSYYGPYFPTQGQPAANSDVIENNIITNVYDVAAIPSGCSDTISTGTVLGAVTAVGQVTNLLVTHNVVHDVSGMGIRNDCYSTAAPLDNLSGLTVSYNALYNLNSAESDAGAIYNYNWYCLATSTNMTISNNYIRDYGAASNLSHGVYLDDGTSNTKVTQNVITGHGTTCFFAAHGGNNDNTTGNICDLSDGATGAQTIAEYQNSASCTASSCMQNNYVQGNIIIGNSSSASGGYSIYTPQNPLIIQNNFVYSYGSGSISDAGSVADVTGTNPQISGWTYTIAAGSPVFGAPVNFPGIPDAWGPPGFVIPESGTPPSSPH